MDSVWPGSGRKFSPKNQALAITLAFVLLRLLASFCTGLGTNEAYAIASGRALSLSYFDHPPLHFWLAHLGELLFGDTRAARSLFILLGAGTSWLMFLFTRRLFGDRAGVWATLALNVSGFFGFVSASWILPDGPLNFFLLAAALVLAPIAEEKSLSLQRWLIAGLFTGLAALSKYHAIFFAGEIFVYMLAAPERRRLLLTPGPWLAAMLALAVFSPVLIWNGDHHWISFGFQGGRAQSRHFAPGLFLSLLLAQLALLTPWVVVPLLGGIRRGFSRSDAQSRFVLWLGFPIALFFSLVPLWSGGGMVQWAMPGWLLLMPLAGRYLAEEIVHKTWPKRWAIGSTVIFVVVAAVFCSEVQVGWLGRAFPGVFRHGDPAADYFEWRLLASRVNERSPIDNGRDFILTAGWREASKIDQGLSGRYHVLVASDDPRNFAVGVHDRDFQNRDGWVILRTNISPVLRTNILHCFLEVSAPSIIVISRGRQPDAELAIWRGKRYSPARCNVQRIND